MSVCISLLRGINMTGHNLIRMKELTLMFREAGFSNAETYIQSGNIVFSCSNEAKTGDISSKIRTSIRENFNLEISVITRTMEELKEVIKINPFLDEPLFDASKMAVIFLEEEPSETQILRVIDIEYPPDKFIITGKEIFIFCPNGFGKTKLYTNFFEIKMGVTGTARNWRTVTKLFEMAEKKI